MVGIEWTHVGAHGLSCGRHLLAHITCTVLELCSCSHLSQAECFDGFEAIPPRKLHATLVTVADLHSRRNPFVVVQTESKFASRLPRAWLETSHRGPKTKSWRPSATTPLILLSDLPNHRVLRGVWSVRDLLPSHQERPSQVVFLQEDSHPALFSTDRKSLT